MFPAFTIFKFTYVPKKKRKSDKLHGAVIQFNEQDEKKSHILYKT